MSKPLKRALAIISLIAGFTFFKSPSLARAPIIVEPSELIISQNSFLVARSSPEIPKISILYALNSPEIDLYWKIVSEYPLFDKIIECESTWNPNAQNPKSTAYGLCQFIDGTWEYVQKKWNMELDRYNPQDQLYACERLLEEEGLQHWKAVYKCLGI